MAFMRAWNTKITQQSVIFRDCHQSSNILFLTLPGLQNGFMVCAYTTTTLSSLLIGHIGLSLKMLQKSSRTGAPRKHKSNEVLAHPHVFSTTDKKPRHKQRSWLIRFCTAVFLCCSSKNVICCAQFMLVVITPNRSPPTSRQGAQGSMA